MFGLESIAVGVWITLGDGFFGSAAVPRVEEERARLANEAAAALTKCICGAEKNEHGELPCGH